MVSSKQLLSTIGSSLLGPSPPSPVQRVELLHAIRNFLSYLQSLLSSPPLKPSDWAQVQSKEVRLPDSPPIYLDDQDVQIWGLMGQGPQEILRFAAGLWYTERRDLIMVLYTLLSAVVLDQGLEADIQKYLEDLINAGLRQRLISLIKALYSNNG